MPTRTRSAPKSRIKPFPVRLEPSKRARLEVLAKADRRSLSNYILKVLYDHIDAIGMSLDKRRK
jgi:predicted HicB family RNase H-like nuclease